jgi:hypothetical protein
MRSNLNVAKLNYAINQGFRATAQRLAEQHQVEMRAEQWDWPRETQRKNGEVVGNPRNIVDEGSLVESQAVVQIDANNIAIVYDVPHAMINHEGDGNNRPGRPWTVVALQNLDIVQVFNDEVKARI